MADMNGKTVLITGANQGIGLEVAKQLCARGHLVVVSARNKTAGEKVTEELNVAGGTATFLHLDVNDETSIKEPRRRSKIRCHVWMCSSTTRRFCLMKRFPSFRCRRTC